MHNVTAHAVRNGKTIEVTISGLLSNSCYSARIVDIYPGGSRVYIRDPGAAQVFIEELLRPGSSLCLMMLVPWSSTINIPDREHDKVEVFVNNQEVLETPILDPETEFKVIALTGTHTGCSIIPKNATYAGIYSEMFGPASYRECARWIADNCESARTPSS